MLSKDKENVLPTDIALGPAGTLKIMIKASNLGLKPKNQSGKCGGILIMASSIARIEDLCTMRKIHVSVM